MAALYVNVPEAKEEAHGDDYEHEAERDKVPEDNFAGPDQSFPINKQEDVTHAAQLLHHAKDPEAVKAKIKSIARRKGFSLPDTWEDGEKKTDKDDLFSEPPHIPPASTGPEVIDPAFQPTPPNVNDPPPASTMPSQDPQRPESELGIRDAKKMEPYEANLRYSDEIAANVFCGNCVYFTQTSEAKEIGTCSKVHGYRDMDGKDSPIGEFMLCDLFEPYKSAHLVPRHNPDELIVPLEEVEATHKDSAGGYSIEEIFDRTAPQWEMLTDNQKKGLGRVRQLLTKCDVIIHNEPFDRIYPKEVTIEMINDCLPRIAEGTMIMQLEHPEYVQTRGGQKYTHDVERETARVDAIYYPDAQGEVYFDYTILNLPCGRDVKQRFDEAKSNPSRKPYGVSKRFRIAGKDHLVAGRRVKVASFLRLETPDHVEIPAVADTQNKYELLTDSLKVALGLTPPSQNPSNHQQGTNRAGNLSAQETTTLMDETIQGARDELYGKFLAHASAEEVGAAYNHLVMALNFAKKSGTLSTTDHAKHILEAQKDARIAGYRGEKEGPDGTWGKWVGFREGGGFAADMETREAAPGRESNVRDVEDTGASDTQISANSLSDVERAFIKRMMEQNASAQSDEAKRAGIKTACDSERQTNMALKGLPETAQEYILANVESLAADAASVPELIAAQTTAYMASVAPQIIAARGGAGFATGNTVSSMADPRERQTAMTQVIGEMHPVLDAVFSGQAPEWMRDVNLTLVAADRHLVTEMVPGLPDPNSSETISRRTNNMRKRIVPMIQHVAADYAARQHDPDLTPGNWFRKHDRFLKPDFQAVADSFPGRSAMPTETEWFGGLDSILVTNMQNQPSILTTLLIMSLWDMRSLQFVQMIGPGVQPGGRVGWFPVAGSDVGTKLVVPSEIIDWAAMTGTISQKPAAQYDPGLIRAEGQAIPPVQTRITWQSFYAFLRAISVIASDDVRLAMGNGPLNYDVWGRAAFHAAWQKALRIDIALYNEFFDIADRYQRVASASEDTSVAGYLTNNSVYNAAGNIKVNLNPAKAANAAIASTAPFDEWIQYGANVVCVIRLLGPQSAAGGSGGTATPYYGDGTTAVPVVVPWQTPSLNDAGTLSFVTNAPVFLNSATADVTPGGGFAAPVQGYVDDTYQVAAYVGKDSAGNTIAPWGKIVTSTPNYAFDWNTGCVVFTSGYTGLINSSGIAANGASATTKFWYSYVTNRTFFQIPSTLPAGQAVTDYIAQFFYSGDQLAALMASKERYVKPDMGLGDVLLLSKIANAKIFDKLRSPETTNLFPSEDYVFNHMGINYARTNVPGRVGARRLVYMREGATKYAIEQPPTFAPPQWMPDPSGSGNPTAVRASYLQEKSLICTPQVQDQNGVVINAVAATIDVIDLTNAITSKFPAT
jgi:hypothetical protein